MKRAFFPSVFMVLWVFLGRAELAAEVGSGWQVYLSAVDNGDTNGDRELDIGDPTYLLLHLFLGGPAPIPLLCGGEQAYSRNGDVNGDMGIDLSDAIYLLSWLFIGGSAPVPACAPDQLGMGGAAVKTPFKVRYDPLVNTGAPERMWTSDGILHVRGLPQIGPMTGDIEGTVRPVVSFNFNPATGDGELFGTFTIEGTWQGRTGTWEGRFSGTTTAFLDSGRAEGDGSGGLARTEFLGNFIATSRSARGSRPGPPLPGRGYSALSP